MEKSDANDIEELELSSVILRSLQLGFEARPDREATASRAHDERLLDVLARLKEVQVSRESLRKTGIGLLVNSPFCRRHPSDAVRECSRALIQSWKSQIGLASGPKRKAPEIKEPEEKAHSKLPRANNSQDKANSSNACGMKAETSIHGRASNLDQWSVQQLKAYICDLGLKTDGCVEKTDLIHLIQGSKVQSIVTKSRRSSFYMRRVSAPGIGKRKSMRRASVTMVGRKSLLRMRHAKSFQTSEVAMQMQDRKVECMRIMCACDAFEVFGFRDHHKKQMPQKEWKKLVLKRHRDLSLLVHPDKCPEELRGVATRAFQRLEEANKCLLASFSQSCRSGSSCSGGSSSGGGSSNKSHPDNPGKTAQRPNAKAADNRRPCWGGR